MSTDQTYALGNSPVTSVDEAIERIHSLTSWLAPNDGMAPFNTMYLSVIKAIREATLTGYFTNSAFLDQLDLSFVNRYFDAYARSATGAPLPRCWDVLWKLRRSNHHVPLQFALAGMNAHINHDLVLALVDTFTALDADPRDPALVADFNRVNDILSALEPDMRRPYQHGLVERMDDLLGTMDDRFDRWSIAAARQAAWHDAAILWRLRDHPTLRARCEAALDHAVALVGKCLLVPLGRRAHHENSTCCDHSPVLAAGLPA
jgi:AcrR family transcriptional regulator